MSASRFTALGSSARQPNQAGERQNHGSRVVKLTKSRNEAADRHRSVIKAGSFRTRGRLHQGDGSHHRPVSASMSSTGRAREGANRRQSATTAAVRSTRSHAPGGPGRRHSTVSGMSQAEPCRPVARMRRAKAPDTNTAGSVPAAARCSRAQSLRARRTPPARARAQDQPGVD